MPVQARISSPADRDDIADLMRRALGLDDRAVAIDPGFQRWKYWDPHPLSKAGRSYVLIAKERVVAHGCRWPMRILTTAGAFDAFHLIDWAADSTHAGAGLQVLRDACEHSAALFSIGGSSATRRILPALGDHLRRRPTPGPALTYRVAGEVYFLSRPLRALSSAMRQAPPDWKTPARIVRSVYRAVLPLVRLPASYSFGQISPQDIPRELWPLPGPNGAITERTPELLRHFEQCPALGQPMSFVLTQHGQAMAYFFLVLARSEARVADYGPARMGEHTAEAMGMAVQLAAKRHYPDALRISIATSEAHELVGLLRSGFRQSHKEEIRALVADPALKPVTHYRLTYLDLDALSL